jgi:hypothetical protein
MGTNKENENQHEKRCAFVKEKQKQIPGSWPANGDWLKTLYQEYQQRYRSLDNLVWTISAIMLPLSLAPYVVLVNLPMPCLWQIGLLAGGSLLMTTCWCIAAGKLLYDNQKWLNRIWAIEKTLGILDFARPSKGEPTGPYTPLKLCDRKDIIKWTIFAVWVINVIVWVLLMIFRG